MAGPTSFAKPKDAEHVLEAGGDLEARDNNGSTPLLGAARSGRRGTSFVEYFVKKGANVDARDNEGWTVYELAARHNRTGILRQILERGQLIDLAFDVVRSNNRREVLENARASKRRRLSTVE